VKVMRKVVSLLMGIGVAGGSYAGSRYGANLWLLLPCLGAIYFYGLTMILFSAPLILFATSMLLTAGIIWLFNIDALTTYWGVGLGLFVLAMQYFFWVRGPQDE
jgi:hypothetical protein